MREVIEKLIQRNISISTMESCTAGMMASSITDVEGASEVFPGGYVTYSNKAKVKAGVDATVIVEKGVYSTECAMEMSRAAKKAFGTDMAVGITGTLGRVDPMNPEGEVGNVYADILYKEAHNTMRLLVPADITERHDQKKWVVERILEKIADLLD